MRRYIKAFQSLIAVIVIKVFHPKKFFFCGLPVNITTKNLAIVDGRVNLGSRINIMPGTRLVGVGGILDIGNGVYFNSNVNCCCRNSVIIEDGCRFGPNVCIYDHDHIFTPNGVTDEYKLGNIVIGKACWIGANSVILRDTYIGEGCVISAGAIVKGIIPPHSLVIPEKRMLSIKPIEPK